MQRAATTSEDEFQGESTDNDKYAAYLSDARKRIERGYSGLWQHLMEHASIRKVFDTFSEAAKQQLPEKEDVEQHLSKPLDDLLNTISSAVVGYAKLHCICLHEEVVWFRAHRREIHGGFMNKATKPDRRCVIRQPLPEKINAANDENLGIGELLTEKQKQKMLQTPWQEMVGVGEDNVKPNANMGQLKSYLIDHLKYRVDYPVARGVHHRQDGDEIPTAPRRHELARILEFA